MKKTLVSELRTFATVQTNAPKMLYGSGAVGAGFKDVYYTFKTVRGKFEQKNSTRVLEDGSIITVNVCRYTVRYETPLMGILDLQTRFIITRRGTPKPTVYTLITWNVVEFDKEAYFIFELSEYGK